MPQAEQHEAPAEILEYCEKATAGPWTIRLDTCRTCRDEGTAEFSIDEIPGGHHAEYTRKEDAGFIAKARTDLPAMAKLVLELENTLAALSNLAASTTGLLTKSNAERDKLAAQVEELQSTERNNTLVHRMMQVRMAVMSPAYLVNHPRMDGEDHTAVIDAQS